MKDYKEVVDLRYDKEDINALDYSEQNIYSPIHDIGNYSTMVTLEILREYVKLLLKSTGKSTKNLRILDAGCGTGLVTRWISNLLGNTQRIYGFEYSVNRLEYCKMMNSCINYAHGDIVMGIPDEFMSEKFDGIMTFDVLSHIRREEDIIKSVQNIYDGLEDKGLFLWFEINADSHFKNYEADTQGFSVEEMDKYATNAGFRRVYEKGYFKLLPFSNVASLYFCGGRLKNNLVHIYDKVFPGRNNNNLRIYIKEN